MLRVRASFRTHVIDASAVMAFVKRETGADVVVELLDQSIMTSVNFGEVLCKLHERFRVPPSELATRLGRTGLEVAPVDRRVASRFPTIRAFDRRARASGRRERPLALADLCCLAFATEHRLPVLTADRYWADLTHFGLEPEVVLIR